MSVFFFKQKTAYDMRISDWSSDVCSSDLTAPTSVSGTGSSARAAGQTRFSRPLRSRRGLRAPDLVAAGDMAVLVAHRGRAVGGEEDRAVEVDHVAELPEHERRRRGQARAAHVADHHPLAKLARAPGHQQAFGEAAALVELDVDDVE